MTRLQVGQHLPKKAKGCITERKYLWGTVAQIERKVGFHAGRLRKGFFVACLTRVPQANEFEIAGYTNVATHNFNRKQVSSKFDVARLKYMAYKKMESLGAHNLVKIFPNEKHNDDMTNDEQYPSGDGISQWLLKEPMEMKIIKEVKAGEIGFIKV